MARVLITSPRVRDDPAGQQVLEEAGCELVVAPPGQRSEAEMIALIPGIDVAIAGTDPFTERVFGAADRLRLIATRSPTWTTSC
jgi:phosphoglycerate dehydrogenase-like enzyme